MRFFEAAGVPLKTERGRRVFPVSDHAADIAGALADALHKRRVTVVRERVSGLLTDAGRCVGVRAAGTEVRAHAVVVATGGLSYPLTGSTGDGYRFARDCGLKVVPPMPSLVPIVTREDFSALSGLSLRNVTLTVTRREGGREIFSEMGEMLFTHFGVSGPLVLSASAHLPHAAEGRCRLEIDLKPALDEQTLDRRVLRDFEENLNRDFANALHKLLPSKLIPVIVERSGIAPDRKVHEITRAERLSFVHLIKHFTLEITSAGPFREAIITAGGVSVREIDPKTMASKLVNGLYFAGEIMDVDAYTGGFNLQIAWSTGVRAGSAAAERND
jgi:predicted Rossmann fold flavoprotein